MTFCSMTPGEYVSLTNLDPVQVLNETPHTLQVTDYCTSGSDSIVFSN